MLPQIEQSVSLDTADDFVHEAEAIEFGVADLAPGENDVVLKKADLVADDAGHIVVRNQNYDNLYLVCSELPTAYGTADKTAISQFQVNHYYAFSDGTKIFTEAPVKITLG